MNKAKQILLNEARKLRAKAQHKLREYNKLVESAKDLEDQADKIGQKELL